MDDVVLIRAREHAAHAARATKQNQLDIAVDEHSKAAKLYHEAKIDCRDGEAERVIALLETQHNRFAEAAVSKQKLTAAQDRVVQPSKQDVTNATTDVHDKDESAITKRPRAPVSPPREIFTPSLGRGRTPTGSPALAKDIASRRGIPQQRTPATISGISPLHARATMIRGEQRTDRAPTVDTTGLLQSRRHDIDPSPPESARSPVNRANDERFANFYQAMTGGPFSKLSSMLAFAGLPLSESPESLQSANKVKQVSGTSERTEVERYVSKAALNAIEDQQRRRGYSGKTFGGESFYVIPTTGGTSSYAHIASKSQLGTESRAMRELETAVKISADSSSQRDPTGLAIREEELLMENDSLKQLLDKLSHRLQAFESHAQDASMAALTQSIGWNRPNMASTSMDAEERIRAMELKLEQETSARERLDTDNQKLKQIVTKYRSHWDQLKESARARRTGQE